MIYYVDFSEKDVSSMINIGDQIKLILNHSESECIVENLIGGSVFCVSINSKRYAFKWYDSKDYMQYDFMFYENIKNKCQMGNPSRNFLWPINITNYSNEGFGYLMEMIPEGYSCMTEWLSGKLHISTQNLIRISLNLVFSLHMLSMEGLCGADLHEGNIFFNPDTGSVLIGDTDEIAPYGLAHFEYGMKRYHAPETVLDYSVRNLQSDRHSLCVLLFLLLYKAHPLEGKKTMDAPLSDTVQNEIYGKNPLFVFDPEDTSNSLYEPIAGYSLAMWELTPDYVKTLFELAFSQKALNNPNKRPIELQWIKCLARWESELEKCNSCGNYFVGNPQRVNICPFCGNKNTLKYYIQIEQGCFTVQSGNKIRKCLLDITDNTLLDYIVTFESKRDDKQILGIKNCSKSEWLAFKDEKRKIIAPGRIIQVFDGLVIRTPYSIFRICKKSDFNNAILPKNDSLYCQAVRPAKVIQKEMLILFIVDTSKSMQGMSIHKAFDFIENALQDVQEFSKHQSDIIVKFSILEFSTKTRWVPRDVPLTVDDDIDIECPDCRGISDIGGALKELNESLNRNRFMTSVDGGRLSPVILFFTDGLEPYSFYGYNWEVELQNIENNMWYRDALKCAVHVSENTNYSVLEKLVGTSETVFEADSTNLMKYLLHGRGTLIS